MGQFIDIFLLSKTNQGDIGGAQTTLFDNEQEINWLWFSVLIMKHDKTQVGKYKWPKLSTVFALYVGINCQHTT